MAEPISTATAGAVVTAVGITALLPGIDAGALIGAFAGAVTFALNAKDTAIPARLGYTFVSLVMGYVAVPSVADLSPIKEPAVAAFLVSALVIAATLTAMDRIKKIDVGAAWDAIVSIFKKGA